MNYLQLAQKVRQLVGIQGTGPSSVTATGYEGLILTTVQDIWRDIQNARKKWKWMRASKSFLTAANTTVYTPTTIFGPTNRFKLWYPETCYVTINTKKVPVRYIENYDAFVYRHVNDIEGKEVYEFSIRPSDFALVFNTPDTAYTIDIDYHKSVQELSAATDVPEIPDSFHMLIAYGAAARYSASIQMPTLYQTYSAAYAEIMGDLLREQNVREFFKVRGIA